LPAIGKVILPTQRIDSADSAPISTLFSSQIVALSLGFLSGDCGESAGDVGQIANKIKWYLEKADVS